MSSLHLQAQLTSGDGMLEDAAPAFPTGSRPVTWMVKHVYKGHTAETLHSVLTAVVDPRDYYMIYVPFDSRKRANARYAFITFADADRAFSALSKLDGLPWSVIDDRAAQDKFIKVMPAHVQGIRASLLQHTVDGADKFDAQQVLLLHNGRRVDFQTALRLYCSPPMRNPPCSTSHSRKLTNKPLVVSRPPPPGLEGQVAGAAWASTSTDSSMDYHASKPPPPRFENEVVGATSTKGSVDHHAMIGVLADFFRVKLAERLAQRIPASSTTDSFDSFDSRTSLANELTVALSQYGLPNGDDRPETIWSF